MDEGWMDDSRTMDRHPSYKLSVSWAKKGYSWGVLKFHHMIYMLGQNPILNKRYENFSQLCFLKLALPNRNINCFSIISKILPLNPFQRQNGCQKWVQWPQISWKPCIIIVAMTNSSWAISQPWFSIWLPAAILDFKIQLVSLDKICRRVLRNVYAKRDLCIMTWSQHPIFGA